VATAKKQKGGKGEASHHSHSTSHNHHKYEREIDLQDQATSKKQLLTLKQLKMVIRCCGEYCNYQPHRTSNSQSY
jgi:DnaJ-class molecular chaperone